MNKSLLAPDGNLILLALKPTTSVTDMTQQIWAGSDITSSTVFWNNTLSAARKILVTSQTSVMPS